MYVSWKVVGGRWSVVATNRAAAILYLILAVISIPSAAVAQTALPETIPIFPLEDVMLFPEMSVPLHIFEPRYKAMVADALKGNRIIGMVLLRPGYEKDYERSPSVFQIGCAGVINEVEELPNGEYNIVLGALTKYRITREEASTPYRIAHVTPVAEETAEGDKATLHERRLRLEALVRGSRGRIGFRAPPDGISDENLVNGISQLARMDELDRERLLEQPNALARADALIAIMEKIIGDAR